MGTQCESSPVERSLFRNRYLDPEIGRFVTTDPMQYLDGPSLYQAFGYDPVNMGDPLGLFNFREAFSAGVQMVKDGVSSVVNFVSDQVDQAVESAGRTHDAGVELAGAIDEGTTSSPDWFEALMEEDYDRATPAQPQQENLAPIKCHTLRK